MTRILHRDETGPTKVAKDEIEGKAIYICRCGLSASQPFCDGSHGRTRDEQPDRLYAYTREDGALVRRPVQVVDAPETDASHRPGTGRPEEGRNREEAEEGAGLA